MNRGHAPWWFTALLAVLALPMFLCLYFVNATPEGSGARWLAWFYPAYIALSSLCAWICYPDRRALAWILAALMALSDAAMWAFIYMPVSI